VLTLGRPEEVNPLDRVAAPRLVTEEDKEDSGRLVAVLRDRVNWYRDFRLLMAGSFISMLGSRISTIAFPLLALFLTNSPVDAGLVAFAATIPSALVYIPAGALVDHWNPWRAMLVCESGRGVAVAVVAISLIAGKPSIFLLIPVVIVEEVLEVFSTLAERRCARNLVPQDRVSSAQASIETKTHVVVLAGRPLGVFLFSFEPIAPFFADAASFLISAFFIATLKGRHPVAVRPGRLSGKRLREDIIIAMKVLLKDKYARAALAFSASGTLIGQALIMIFLASARTSGLPSFRVGLVLAASGAGGILGAVFAPRLRTPFKSSLVLFQVLAWSVALAFLATWGWRSFLCMAVVMALLSLTGALGNIEMDTYLVQAFDENMLARAISFGRLIAYTASAIGPMLGGMLIQFCGTQIAILVLAGIALTLWLLACSVSSLRNYYEDVRPMLNVRRSLRRIVACLCPLAAAPLAAATARVAGIAVCFPRVAARALTFAVNVAIAAASYVIVLSLMAIALAVRLASNVPAACVSRLSSKSLGHAHSVDVASPTAVDVTGVRLATATGNGSTAHPKVTGSLGVLRIDAQPAGQGETVPV
jgi:MFS family permease